jgi:hypothetical protein
MQSAYKTNIYSTTHPKISNSLRKNTKYPFNSGSYSISDSIQEVLDSKLTKQIAEFE